MSGKVYLVGAGPGDPGLLTVKARALIEGADLIVYDYLANPDHLVYAQPGAQKICVGKRFRYHPLSQGKINRLIVQAARQGQIVVRLKGGDPYLFGRGGEEALYLQKHRVPFQVIPGVTSATACAAYAGIPLTHRDYSSSITFLTGHKADDKSLDGLGWEKIAQLKGTLVLYMGFYHLKIIAERLMKAGMPRRTRVAVIEWGTLPRQRSCDGTLSDIASVVKKRGLRAPCIIVIGRVVELRRKLNWFEKLPLFGKRIVITRMREKSREFARKLEALGAEVLEFPTIEIRPLRSFKAIDAVVRRIDDFDWVVFTSTYGVETFFETLRMQGFDARRLNGVRFATVGPETDKVLGAYGVRSDLRPRRYETRAIVDAFREKLSDLSGKKILLVRTDIAPPALEEGLKKLGVDVARVVAYHTRIPREVPNGIRRMILGARVDAVAFTSSSTAEHFVKIIGRKRTKALSKKIAFASIGPVTSATLRRLGVVPACEARIFTTDGLTEALCGACGA